MALIIALNALTLGLEVDLGTQYPKACAPGELLGAPREPGANNKAVAGIADGYQVLDCKLADAVPGFQTQLVLPVIFGARRGLVWHTCASN